MGATKEAAHAGWLRRICAGFVLGGAMASALMLGLAAHYSTLQVDLHFVGARQGLCLVCRPAGLLSTTAVTSFTLSGCLPRWPQ